LPHLELILPFRFVENGVSEFAITKLSDIDAWLFLFGGGEDGETPLQAAKRKTIEEGDFQHDAILLPFFTRWLS